MSIATLDVSFNDLTGTLPRSLYSSKRLRKFDFSTAVSSNRQRFPALLLMHPKVTSLTELYMVSNINGLALFVRCLFFLCKYYTVNLNLSMNKFSGRIDLADWQASSISTFVVMSAGATNICLYIDCIISVILTTHCLFLSY